MLATADMKALEDAVRSVQKDGLLWGACESPYLTPMHALSAVNIADIPPLLFCVLLCKEHYVC